MISCQRPPWFLCVKFCFHLGLGKTQPFQQRLRTGILECVASWHACLTLVAAQDIYVDAQALNSQGDLNRDLGWFLPHMDDALDGAIDARSFNLVRSSGKAGDSHRVAGDFASGIARSHSHGSWDHRRLFHIPSPLRSVPVGGRPFASGDAERKAHGVHPEAHVIKSSAPDVLRGECHWYRSIPPELSCYFPRPVEIQEGEGISSVSSITMEKARETFFALLNPSDHWTFGPFQPTS